MLFMLITMEQYPKIILSSQMDNKDSLIREFTTKTLLFGNTFACCSKI